jgi:hypothetical protein
MNKEKVKRAVELLSRAVEDFDKFGVGWFPAVQKATKDLEALVNLKPKELTEEILKEINSKFVEDWPLERILIMEEPFPKGHLTHVTGVLCDFDSYRDVVLSVYIK